jgi:hypothetical protein
VVAVGLTLSEPLALAEVNVPGVIEMLVAPVAIQFSVLLAPVVTLAGVAANEEIVGADPLPVPVPVPEPVEDWEDFPAAHPAKAMQMSRNEAIASQ